MKSRRATILFRVGAGPGIGLGHLRRSISLAQALRRQGVRSRFLVSGSEEGLRYLSRLGFGGIRIPSGLAWSRRELEILKGEAIHRGCRSVLVDSCDLPLRYLAELKGNGFFVAVRDDLGRSRLPVDLVLNGNANAGQLPYEPNGLGSRFLLGPGYLVLPTDLKRGPHRAIRHPVRQILLTLGGEDPQGWMPRLLRSWEALPGGFSVTAVVGPFFRRSAELKRAVRSLRRKVRLVRSPTSLHRYMRQADLAVSGAGQTLYELACVGCPTVALQMAGNQRGQLQALAREGVVRSAGSVADKALIPRVQAAVRSLLEEPEVRQRMANAGRRLVDGQGAERVARIIQKRIR